MQERLNSLAQGKSAWRFSAQELLGLSAYQNDDLSAAEERFGALLVDAGTPRNMRDRANVMLALIVSQTAADSDSSASTGGSNESETEGAQDSETTTN
jgi:hypothetical protein